MCWTERLVDFIFCLFLVLDAAWIKKKKEKNVSVMFVMQLSRMCCVLRTTLLLEKKGCNVENNNNNLVSGSHRISA